MSTRIEYGITSRYWIHRRDGMYYVVDTIDRSFVAFGSRQWCRDFIDREEAEHRSDYEEECEREREHKLLQEIRVAAWNQRNS